MISFNFLVWIWFLQDKSSRKKIELKFTLAAMMSLFEIGDVLRRSNGTGMDAFWTNNPRFISSTIETVASLVSTLITPPTPTPTPDPLSPDPYQCNVCGASSKMRTNAVVLLQSLCLHQHVFSFLSISSPLSFSSLFFYPSHLYHSVFSFHLLSSSLFLSLSSSLSLSPLSFSIISFFSFSLSSFSTIDFQSFPTFSFFFSSSSDSIKECVWEKDLRI